MRVIWAGCVMLIAGSATLNAQQDADECTRKVMAELQSEAKAKEPTAAEKERLRAELLKLRDQAVQLSFLLRRLSGDLAALGRARTSGFLDQPSRIRTHGPYVSTDFTALFKKELVPKLPPYTYELSFTPDEVAQGKLFARKTVRRTSDAVTTRLVLTLWHRRE